MRALTIHQPFASLIMAGAKPFEFRTRRPPAGLIGQRIVIHASTRPIRPALAGEMFLSVRDRGSLSIIINSLDNDRALPVLARAWQPHGEPLPISAGLGTVIIGEPRPAWQTIPALGIIPDEEAHLWAWPVLEIERWPIPVPASGAQGFWRWTEGVPA